jgi:hypothetical protein
MPQSYQPGDRVFWWRYTRTHAGYAYAATVLAVRGKRVKIAIAATKSSSGIVTRSVAADRLQHVRVFYEKAIEQGPMVCEPPKSWGKLTRYVEIGEDLCALRHVDVFENGNMLRYDRSHWVDDFGMLCDALIDRNRKERRRSVEIEPAEFEHVWQIARQSPTRRDQVATACMSRMGAVPIWLTIKRWQPPLA